MTEIRVIAIDIETNGCYLDKNEIVSIGYCVGDTKGKVEQKGRIDFEVSTKFEKRCYDEFWKDHMDKYKVLQHDVLDPGKAIKSFVNLIDELDSKYDLRIISDNPSFDIMWINYYYNQYLGRRPLCYKNNTSYRPIYDTKSYSRGALAMTLEDKWTDDSKVIQELKLDEHIGKICADHFPDNDAEYIYKLYTGCIEANKSIKRHDLT
jgi:hypothetical protein